MGGWEIGERHRWPCDVATQRPSHLLQPPGHGPGHEACALLPLAYLQALAISAPCDRSFWEAAKHYILRDVDGAADRVSLKAVL